MEHYVNPKNGNSIRYEDGEILHVIVNNRQGMENVKFKIERLHSQAYPNQNCIMSVGNSNPYRILRAQRNGNTLNIEIGAILFLE